MALSRITNVAGTSRITAIRVLKKDAGDTANTHAASTVRLKETGGSYLSGTWVYDPSTAGGGYTHYADIDITSLGGYYGVTFVVEVRDTSGGTYEVWSSVFDVDVTTVLYEATAAVPGKPTLNITSTTSNSQALNWSAPTGGPTGYRLLRSTSPSSGFVQIGGDLTGTSYNSTGLAAATRYYYYLIAYNGTGDSTASDTVNEITTSTGGGTATATPSITSLSSGQIKRHQHKYVISTEAFAVVDFELGAGGDVLRGSADSAGVCVIYAAEKIPVDVSSVRVRAQAVGKVLSDWSSAVTVVDGLNSDPWFAVYETAAGGTYEAWRVTFSGDPDSSPTLEKGAKISESPRATVALARADGQTYLNNL